MSRNGSSGSPVQFYFQSLQVTLTLAVHWLVDIVHRVYNLMESASPAVCDVMELE